MGEVGSGRPHSVLKGAHHSKWCLQNTTQLGRLFTGRSPSSDVRGGCTLEEFSWGTGVGFFRSGSDGRRTTNGKVPSSGGL